MAHRIEILNLTSSARPWSFGAKSGHVVPGDSSLILPTNGTFVVTLGGSLETNSTPVTNFVEKGYWYFTDYDGIDSQVKCYNAQGQLLATYNHLATYVENFPLPTVAGAYIVTSSPGLPDATNNYIQLYLDYSGQTLNDLGWDAMLGRQGYGQTYAGWDWQAGAYYGYSLGQMAGSFTTNEQVSFVPGTNYELTITGSATVQIDNSGIVQVENGVLTESNLLAYGAGVSLGIAFLGWVLVVAIVRRFTSYDFTGGD